MANVGTKQFQRCVYIHNTMIFNPVRIILVEAVMTSRSASCVAEGSTTTLLYSIFSQGCRDVGFTTDSGITTARSSLVFNFGVCFRPVPFCWFVFIKFCESVLWAIKARQRKLYHRSETSSPAERLLVDDSTNLRTCLTVWMMNDSSMREFG